jgi:hypothetical protein
LPEFAKLAVSFSIPTGILYDEDSSDFKDNQQEELAFNAQLDAFGRPDLSVRVWKISKTYEDNLRKAVGEAQYQVMCQKYAKTGKPTRARLMATEKGLPIPAPLEDVLRWLANKHAGVSPKGS